MHGAAWSEGRCEVVRGAVEICRGLSPRVGGHIRSRGATERDPCLSLESSWLHLVEWVKQARLVAEMHWCWGSGVGGRVLTWHL